MAEKKRESHLINVMVVDEFVVPRRGRVQVLKNVNTRELFMRIVAPNGRELVRSSETYKTMQGMQKCLESLSNLWTVAIKNGGLALCKKPRSIA